MKSIEKDFSEQKSINKSFRRYLFIFSGNRYLLMGSDEKFKDVLDNLDETTVKEEKEEVRGSLSIEEKIGNIIGDIKEKEGLETDLKKEKLTEIIKLYFEGKDDKEISKETGIEESKIRKNRSNLYLPRDKDLDKSPIDKEKLEDLDELSKSKIREEFDLDEETTRFYYKIIKAEDKPYKERFEEALSDEFIAERMTSEVKEKGLEDATEDMEIDVDV